MRNDRSAIELLLDMSEDSSLRLHESEVSALRRLAVEIADLASWREHVNAIPPQYLHIFAEVARRRSSELFELAAQLSQLDATQPDSPPSHAQRRGSAPASRAHRAEGRRSRLP
jgi:hypothetical protein